MKILIRADGSHERGMGHISKQITLANKLECIGHEIFFVTIKNESTAKILESSNKKFAQFEGNRLANIDGFIYSFNPDVVILDILDTTSSYINELKRHEIKIVTFDNTDISSFECDIAFNVMYYHTHEMKKHCMCSHLYEGYKYIIIDERYKDIKRPGSPSIRRILLTQGGADTNQKIPFLMEILAEMRHELFDDLKTNVVIGPAFFEENIQRIREIAEKEDMFEVHFEPKGLAKLIKCSDMVITAGGTTMWEAAACKRPVYIYINEEFEHETAMIIKDLGFGMYDGYFAERDTVKNTIRRMIDDNELTSSLIENMKKCELIDGLDRVVETMHKHNVLSDQV